MGFPAHSLSPAELAALLAAEREGAPFIAYRDSRGKMNMTPLPDADFVRIGRTVDNDVVLDDDPQVSRLHARIERAGGGWALADDGVSRNGSYINGERVLRNRRLADGDVVRIGKTSILFRAPGEPGADSTVAASTVEEVRLSEPERRVLVALCRPLLAAGLVAAPASNKEIAEQLYLSLPTVKSHIRSLFTKLGVDDLPQNRKRADLVRRALEAGLVTARDAPS